MCIRYGYQAPVSRLADAFSEIGIPLRFKDGAVPNHEPREHTPPFLMVPNQWRLRGDGASPSAPSCGRTTKCARALDDTVRFRRRHAANLK